MSSTKHISFNSKVWNNSDKDLFDLHLNWSKPSHPDEISLLHCLRFVKILIYKTNKIQMRHLRGLGEIGKRIFVDCNSDKNAAKHSNAFWGE